MAAAGCCASNLAGAGCCASNMATLNMAGLQCMDSRRSILLCKFIKSLDRMSKTNPGPALENDAKRARLSVLTVIVSRGSDVQRGTAFVIKRDDQAQRSILLTCNHVLGTLEDDDVVHVRRMVPRSRGGGVEQLLADVLYQNNFSDVAILSVPGLTSVRPLPFATVEITAGVRIIAVAYADPKQLFTRWAHPRIPTLLPGRVKPRGIVPIGTRNHVRLSHVLCDCICTTGMSGGPVLSRHGVIAMVASGIPGTTHTIPRDTIVDVLKKYLRYLELKSRTR